MGSAAYPVIEFGPSWLTLVRTSARIAVGVLPRSSGWRAGGAGLVFSIEFRDAVAARIANEIL
ncbi:hypothetical protein, partial [Mycobacterium montefiorense]|uniref:hypothetical protein n=1 Tax=Mycobacterium montefiorense TaxID=154654 RepID=UPI002232AABB